MQVIGRILCNLQCITILICWSFSQSVGQSLNLTTTSDSALYYYDIGWQQVLDYGHFTNSEKAYRRMYEFDPEFLVGASLLARITPDPEERRQLLKSIEHGSEKVQGDEKLLLDLFINLTRLYIFRESGDDQLEAQITKTLKLGVETLGELASKYPDDHYYKAEYIEFLHATEGPQVALDSLNKLFPEPTPFMFGYAAQLRSELKKFDEATQIAHQLEQRMKGKDAPYVHMVFAKIYLEQNNLDLAKVHIQKALAIDPGHILALRMQENF